MSRKPVRKVVTPLWRAAFVRFWNESQTNQETVSQCLGLSRRGLQLILSGKRCPDGISCMLFLIRLDPEKLKTLQAEFRRNLQRVLVVALACPALAEGWWL